MTDIVMNGHHLSFFSSCVIKKKTKMARSHLCCLVLRLQQKPSRPPHLPSPFLHLLLPQPLRQRLTCNLLQHPSSLLPSSIFFIPSTQPFCSTSPTSQPPLLNQPRSGPTLLLSVLPSLLYLSSIKQLWIDLYLIIKAYVCIFWS